MDSNLSSILDLSINKSVELGSKVVILMPCDIFGALDNDVNCFVRDSQVKFVIHKILCKFHQVNCACRSLVVQIVREIALEVGPPMVGLSLLLAGSAFGTAFSPACPLPGLLIREIDIGGVGAYFVCAVHRRKTRQSESADVPCLKQL